MSKTLINPFELLGVTEKSTVREARKAYYNLALLCHPDCGGHEESMMVLVNAYAFVEQQIKNKTDVSSDIGEQLEEEFKKFDLQMKAEIPQMRELFDLAHGDFNKKFNQQFKEITNPFSEGYGKLMDENEENNDTDEEWIVPTKEKFENEIMIYKEPHVRPDTYGNHLRYDVTSVDDFSNYEGGEYDYKKAHSELENVPKNFKSESDKPIEEFEVIWNRLKERRDIKDKCQKYSRIDLLLKEPKKDLKIIDEE